MEKTKEMLQEVRSKSLFNIANEFTAIEEELMLNGGKLTEDLQKQISINKDELTIKSENYIQVINKVNIEVGYIKTEIKRLNDLKKVRENVVKRLKDSIDTAMKMYDIDTIELPLHKINFRKSESVAINCEIDQLPSDCKIIKVEPISKVELKKMLKEGRDIEGIELIINQNLQIK